ncbi:DEAD/DEAH box helicase [Candidatus Micrarchaeota archaeon]|nr:DEAD/DEAH box helicase [Candidatus Micrarchaeota archaeon]
MAFVIHPLIKENSIESRIYQEVLVARVLEKGNSLVVAPTALGKTVVASMVSAFLLQQKPEKKILIVSPTKPLAVQHHKSFQKFLKLPEEQITLMTGSISSKKRIPLWENSKVISATPQSIENDLIQGKISFKEVSLIVFDEAHRAVGDYSYVFLAQNYMKQNPEGLILALTASPGGKKERIDDVCKNLFIKNIEIKSEKDADVKPYVHEITTEWIKVNLPDEFLEIKYLLRNFMKEQLVFLKKFGFAKSISVQYIRKKDLLEMQSKIRKRIASNPEKNPALFTAISRLAALLKVSHAELLLETQGINSLNDYFFRLEKDSAKTKAAKFLLSHQEISKAIAITKQLYEKKIEHPKLIELINLLKKQFAENPESKVLVFNHYRDSVSFLEKQLNAFSEIKAKKFIGQAMKENNKGMTQKEQIQTITDLKEGKYNVLLCTSVGEEGLDIPSVDLVVFFEPVPSEIRTIQRRGRTGRLSKGRTIILMAKNTRDEAFYWSSVAKEKKMKSTLSGMKLMNSEINSDLRKEARKMESQTTLNSFSGQKDFILIFVDSREQASNAVRELSKLDNVSVKVKQLELGDYVLSDEVIIERKTVEDFLSSMLDGRLFSQLIDLSANCKKPLMIIEGNQKELFTLRNIHENAIKGALSSILLDYQVPILFTDSVEETVSFLYLIAKREQLGKGKEIRLRVGRKGLTENELQQFVVESLPSVGPTLAKNLLRKFGSVKKVFNADEKKLMKTEMIGEKESKRNKKTD